jgi:hypothetical protein
MHFLLKINPQFSVGSDHNIGTNAFVRRNVSVRIFDVKISRIVRYPVFVKLKAASDSFWAN